MAPWAGVGVWDWVFILPLSIVGVGLVLVAWSIAESWVQAQKIRLASQGRLPPALPFSELRKLLSAFSRSSPENSGEDGSALRASIRTVFSIAEQWFAQRKDRTWSLEVPGPGWFCFRRFVLVADEGLLRHVLVTKQSCFTKHHAYGVLERFRRTTLPTSGVDAWREVHRLVSKFGRDMDGLECMLHPLIDRWIDNHFGRGEAQLRASPVWPSTPPSTPQASARKNSAAPPVTSTSDVLQAAATRAKELNRKTPSPGSSGGQDDPDTARSLRMAYWQVVMLLVLGDDSPEAAQEYEEAWTTCIERLDSPSVFLFWFAQYLPTSLNRRYASTSARLRQRVRAAVDAAWDTPAAGVSGASPTGPERRPFTFLAIVADEAPSQRLSREDATEVLLELLFTGASSVTTTMSWLLWHLATDTHVQERLRHEIDGAVASRGDRPSAADLSKLPFLDAVLRETLRLYSPIHIGRHCLRDTTHEGISIPAGTDIAANMWFIHRNPDIWPDPHTFRPERFLGQPTNVAGFHPFSMGMRGCPGKAVAFTMCKLLVGRLVASYEIFPDAQRQRTPPEFSGSVVLSNTPVEMFLLGRSR